MPFAQRDKIYNYHQRRSAQQSEINRAFIDYLIEVFQGKDSLESLELIDVQHKVNFLALVKNALAQAQAAHSSRMTVAAGVLSYGFAALTEESPEAFIAQYAGEQPEGWAIIFKSMSFNSFNKYFPNTKLGSFWYYLALHFDLSYGFFQWVAMGGDHGALSPSAQDKVRQLNLTTHNERDYLATASTHNKVGALIAQPLSRYRAYLTETPHENPPVQQVGLYPRSDKHPVANSGTRVTRDSCENLANGDKAHMGDYTNPMQALGDEWENINDDPEAVDGNGQLYNACLAYKSQIAKSIADKVGDQSHINVGAYNDYPCVMVFIKTNNVYLPQGRKVYSDAALEAWVDVLLSLFIGLVKYRAGVLIELVRRSSFNFCGPSGAPTGMSMRISVGIIPQAYADVLANALLELNNALAELQQNQANYKKPRGIFYGSKDHKAYLSQRKKDPLELEACSNLLQVLFAKADTMNKSTLQNMVRAAFSLESLSSQVFNYLSTHAGASVVDAFVHAIEWAVGRFKLEKKTKTTLRLTFDQGDGAIIYDQGNALPVVSMALEDERFWRLVDDIISNARTLNFVEPTFRVALSKLTIARASQRLEDFHYQLEALNMGIFVHAVNASPTKGFPDAYGSDSEEEGLIGDRLVSAKKLIVHNGMRAILATLMGIREHYLTKDPSFNAHVYVGAAYYEVMSGIKLLSKHYKKSVGAVGSVSVAKRLVDANVLIIDLNACVIDGKATQDVTTLIGKSRGKILIFDMTSATTEQCQRYLGLAVMAFERFNTAIFVSSGLKAEQLGADRNHYGTVRIFSTDKTVRDSIYAGIKAAEPPLESKISHHYRRTMKRLNGSPRNCLLFPPGLVSAPKAERPAPSSITGARRRLVFSAE